MLCAVLGFAIYAGYVLIFSPPGAMRTYSRFRRWIEGTVAALFTFAGFGLIRSVMTR